MVSVLQTGYNTVAVVYTSTSKKYTYKTFRP